MSDQSLGHRIKIRREELGLTQAELAHLIGLSKSYVSAIERGARMVDSATTLADIAHALGVADIAQLTGGSYRFTIAGATEDSLRLEHPAVGDLAQMLRRPQMAGHVSPQPLPAPAEVSGRIAQAWRTWNGSPTFYTETAYVLPGLLIDAHRLVRAGAHGPAAHSALSEAYALARHWLRKVGEYALADIAAERALAAAQAADDPLMIAFAGWNLIGNHNAAGRYEDGAEVAAEAIAVLDQAEHHTPSIALTSMRGALLLYASVSTARMDDPDRAWQLWAQADRIARELGTRHFDLRTTFSQANVALYQVGLNVETGRTREATDLAERLDLDAMPSIERKTRHLIDVARAFGRRGEDTAAVSVLLQAERTSPEEVRYSGYARELTRSLVRRGRNMARQELTGLADRMKLTV